MKSSSYYIQQSAFVLRFRYFSKLSSVFRKTWFSILGMNIGKGTELPKIFATWPHQVQIGSKCRLEHHTWFKYDGIWNPGPSIIIGNNVFIGAECEFNIKVAITIGNNSLIASGSRFIDHDHGTKANQLIGVQPGEEAEISIGNDVWIGCNVVVLKGVTIGNGAIVAASSVVNKSIPDNEIWAGVPAKKIGIRV